jgi:hypothetical protein
MSGPSWFILIVGIALSADAVRKWLFVMSRPGLPGRVYVTMTLATLVFVGTLGWFFVVSLK